MKIKQIPEDFVVEEIINIPKKGDNYTYFWLIKKNWTTVRAISEIAKKCQASRKRFSFAGTKDKVAVTKQLVCAFKIPSENLERIKLKDIQIDIIGIGNEKINLGSHEGNHFEIVVRDLSSKFNLKDLENRTNIIKNKGFLNYFDEQRFGSDKNSHIIGKAILKGHLQDAVAEILGTKSRDWSKLVKKFPKSAGIEKSILTWLIKHPSDFAGALRTLHKKIRQIYIHAYQAYVFNSALKVYRGANKELPIPGFKTRLGKDSFSKEIKKVLEEDSIELEDFRCKRMPELASKGSTRLAFVKPEKLSVNKIEDDELNKNKKKIKLEFDLGKGVYATLLIKNLFDINSLSV